MGKRIGVVAAVLTVLMATAGRAGPLPPLPIPPGDRALLVAVADEASVSTRTAGAPFLARPPLFEYLLDHPVFASHVTRALRAARYRIWSTPEGLALDDGWGVTGHFRLVHAMAGTRVLYAWGQFQPGYLPSIHGRAVVMIEYTLTPAEAERSLVNAVVTGYVKLDSDLLGLAARLLGPLADRQAALEARRLVKVFARVSRALDEDPAGAYEKVRQQAGTPRRELAEFRRLLLGR